VSKKSSGRLLATLKMIVERAAGLFAQFEPNRPSGPFPPLVAPGKVKPPPIGPGIGL
jgi:hypothetical protein